MEFIISYKRKDGTGGGLLSIKPKSVTPIGKVCDWAQQWFGSEVVSVRVVQYRFVL